jgi:hypothetical protein
MDYCRDFAGWNTFDRGRTNRMKKVRVEALACRGRAP